MLTKATLMFQNPGVILTLPTMLPSSLPKSNLATTHELVTLGSDHATTKITHSGDVAGLTILQHVPAVEESH